MSYIVIAVFAGIYVVCFIVWDVQRRKREFKARVDAVIAACREMGCDVNMDDLPMLSDDEIIAESRRRMIEEEDAEDIRLIEEARADPRPAIPYEQVRKELGLDDNR